MHSQQRWPGARTWALLASGLIAISFLAPGRRLEAKTLRAARTSEANVPDARARGTADRAFPHLLVAPPGTTPGRSRAARGGDLPPECVQAGFDPSTGLPPSVLPAGARERASRLLRAETPDFLSEANASRRGDGAITLRICVLRVDFLADTPGRKTTGDGRFVLEPPDSTDPERPLLDPPPHDRAYFAAHMEALRRYYEVQSDGWLRLEYDIWPAEDDSAYHLPDTFQYGPWVFSNSNPDVLQHAIDLVGDAIAVADSTDPEIDFRDYQSFVLFHAGADFQGDLNGDTPWDIPSFNLYVSDPFLVEEEGDSCGINLVAVLPETESQDGFEGAMNSVIAHEFGHQLGFFDLYNVLDGGPFVGAYSLMDSGTNLYATLDDPRSPGELVAVRGTLPPSLDPWHKAIFLPTRSVSLYGIDELVTGEADSFEVELAASNLRNDILYLPLNLAEYYLIEQRAIDLNGDSTLVLRSDPETGVILGPEPDSSDTGDVLAFREYDYLLPGEGALVWHVDQKAISRGLSSAFGGINVFYSRPGVAVIEADGVRNIGGTSAEYLGGPYDPYFAGGFQRLGPETWPSTDTNDGTPSGLALEFLDPRGLSMRVRGSIGQGIAGWPVEFAGPPLDGQVMSFDLELDGRMDVVAVSGRSILVYRDDGTPYRPGDEDPLLLRLPRGIEEPIAGQPELIGPIGPEPVIAVVGGGVAWLVNGTGRIAAQWPFADSLVTSAPAMGDSLAFVGCLDGAIRGLTIGSTNPVRTTLALTDRAIGEIAMGSFRRGEVLRVGWMAADGSEFGGLSWSSITGARRGEWRATRDDLPEDAGNDPGIAPAGVLVVERGGAISTLFAWRDGRLEWRDATGERVPGWPAHVEGPLVGGPVIADADGDGELETVALSESGVLHVIGRAGLVETGWPRSIWSEDDGIPPAQVCGLRVWDVDGNGTLEYVTQRTDGFVVALDGQGEAVPGWPLSIGPRALHGPDYVPPADGTTGRIVVGNLFVDGDETRYDRVSALRLGAGRVDLPGAFPAPGFDQRRAGIYPPALVPTPQPADPLEVARRTRLYPNPLDQERLLIASTVDRPATLEIDAFDLAGARVASARFQLEPGADGNVASWDLGRVAPGLYHVRVRVEGDGARREEFHRIAIASRGEGR